MICLGAAIKPTGDDLNFSQQHIGLGARYRLNLYVEALEKVTHTGLEVQREINPRIVLGGSPTALLPIARVAMPMSVEITLLPW